MKLKEQFIQTYQHYSPRECDFIGDFNRLIWSIENSTKTLDSQERTRLVRIDSLILAIDRIIWSDQTASTASYEEAYNKVKKELLVALTDFRK